MLWTYAVGMLGMAVVLGAWLAVQRAWSRAFPEAMDDPDPLAGRMGCHGCGGGPDCRRRAAGEPGHCREEDGR